MALVVVPLNAIGAFGMEPDPLSGIFALLLAAPWSFFMDALASEASVVWNLLLLAAGMVLNGVILAFLCRRVHRTTS
nr:hypothetical protein [Aminobacter sp. HY435]